MSIHMRFYPSCVGALGGAGEFGGAGGYGGVSVQTYYQEKLSAQQQISNLQLQYERALWGERLEKTKLETRLQNPYLALQGAGLGAAYGLGGIGGMGGFGGFGAAVNPYAMAMQSQNAFWGGNRFF
ncbi:MAG: hypothetical protein JWN41_436 [Thermoleophilia bacterium]|nr:hypothetical protein [Thermoleophilia bacterium]